MGFNAIANFAVHLNPDLTPKIGFTDTVPDPRLGKANAEKFLKLLQVFYKDADCAAFFKSHAEMYKLASDRMQKIVDEVDFPWYQKFYGEAPRGSGGGWGNPFGGYSCRLDGFEVPCSMAMQALGSGAGYIDWNHSDHWALGSLGIIRGNGISECSSSDEICRIGEIYRGYNQYESLGTWRIGGFQQGQYLATYRFFTPDPCARMAARAQTVADEVVEEARKGIGQWERVSPYGGNTLAKFDFNFNTLYIGQVVDGSIGSNAYFAETGGGKNSSTPSEVGQQDFKKEFIDADYLRTSKDARADQVHHFAAYFSAGINGAAITSWVHGLSDGDSRSVGRAEKGANVGDQNLAQAAYAIGKSLKLDAGLLKNIGETIRNAICL